MKLLLSLLQHDSWKAEGRAQKIRPLLGINCQTRFLGNQNTPLHHQYLGVY
jgi:hypothetical protein